MQKEIIKLEQLERLHSKDAIHHTMITHAIDFYKIPSLNKTTSTLVTILKNLPTLQLL